MSHVATPWGRPEPRRPPPVRRRIHWEERVGGGSVLPQRKPRMIRPGPVIDRIDRYTDARSEDDGAGEAVRVPDD